MAEPSKTTGVFLGVATSLDPLSPCVLSFFLVGIAPRRFVFVVPAQCHPPAFFGEYIASPAHLRPITKAEWKLDYGETNAFQAFFVTKVGFSAIVSENLSGKEAMLIFRLKRALVRKKLDFLVGVIIIGNEETKKDVKRV